MKNSIFLTLTLFLLNCANIGTTNTNHKSVVIDEAKEFTTLIEKDKIGKEQRVAEAVNLLLNGDGKEKKAAVKFSNKTNCDIILRIYGSTDYLLPVAKNDKNFVILEKGYYNIKYYTCKDLNTEHLYIEDSKEYTIDAK